MSGALYGIDIDDLEKTMEEKKRGGTMIGNQRIHVMKYADDVALVADTEEELRGMLKELEIYTEENKMEVNVKKTKILICRNGGRKKKGKKWMYKGSEVEEVKEFKYLGYHFTTRNSAGKQKKGTSTKSTKGHKCSMGNDKKEQKEQHEQKI
ncbi:uncharacterized protein LOC128668125 [Microplitis demolitor]|uniref:uncharacterized protein LOC128668125 n=1 Tax=Microplitis demolitor TaxID=69319 RepID=UPI00235B673E|nr:uncharacterized protein LOC128668125 [Microplitis demolitor]